jgi:hypothetical protein
MQGNIVFAKIKCKAASPADRKRGIKEGKRRRRQESITPDGAAE